MSACPSSLVFAKAGLRVGIYDTNQATLDRIAAGEMPFLENGADELLREVLATGRLEFGADGSMIERTETARRRHRHAGRRVPRPVDDGLREGGQPDRAAPPRRRARRPAQHRLPGHDRLRRASTSRRRAARSTSRSARSGSPRATRSRSCTRCRRSSAPTTTGPPSGRPPCSSASRARRSGRRPRKPSSPSCSPTRGAT